MFVLWDTAVRSSPASRECLLWIFSTEKTTAKLTRKTEISSISPPPPTPPPPFLSVAHSLDFFFCQPFKPEITGAVTFIIPFILVWSPVQPPGETLLPVSICFEFVVYTECCVFVAVTVFNNLQHSVCCWMLQQSSKFYTQDGWKLSSNFGGKYSLGLASSLVEVNLEVKHSKQL